MKGAIAPKALSDALPESAAFLETFAPLSQRHTSRDSMEHYLIGLLTDLPHKTADPIAAEVAGTSTKCLQHLLTDVAWDTQALDEAHLKQLLDIHQGLDAHQVPYACAVSGLDQYQGRHRDGPHRHLAPVMFAYSFLIVQCLQFPLPPEEVFPSPSLVVRYLTCLGRSCSGSSRISSSGLSTPNRSSPSVFVETNKVVLVNLLPGQTQQQSCSR